MRDRLERLKHFAIRHKVVIAYTVGYGAGAAVGVSAMKSSMDKTHMPRHLLIYVDATTEKLKEMLDEAKESGANHPLGLVLNDRVNNASVKIMTLDTIPQ
jgi:hypothetical protein